MMHTGHNYRDLEQGPATIRALRSLAPRDADAITQAVAAVGDGWSVQTSDDYDGYLCILVEPQDETAGQLTYLISGTVNRIELAEMHHDEMHTIE